jgi:agmatine deiminase
MVAYANFYVANGGVVVPIGGHELDEPALATLWQAFPDREVVGVLRQHRRLRRRVHCINPQIPVPNFDTRPPPGARRE